MARATNDIDNSAPTPRQTRPRKSAAEKAQAEYEKAVSRSTKAGERVAKAQAEVQAAVDEQTAAQRFLDYVSANPDLPPQTGDGESAEAEADAQVTEPA